MREQVTWVERTGVITAALSCLAFVTLAGEGVTFSDRNSNRRPVTEGRGAARRFSTQNPFGGFDSGSSSLQSIPATPFASPQPTPLSPRDRERLQQQRDWIMNAPEDRLRSSDDVNRALGVRDYQPETESKENEAAQGNLVRFYQKLEAAEADAAKATSLDPSRERPTDSLSPLGADSRSGSTPFGAPSSFQHRDGRPESRGPRFSDLSLGGPSEPLGTLGRQPGQWDGLFDRSRNNDRPSTFSVLETNPGAPKEPRDLERLLGGNPVTSPLAQSPITSLDPVTAYPDPTREPLNPVVSSPVGTLPSPLQADTRIGRGGRQPLLGASPATRNLDRGGSLRGSLGDPNAPAGPVSSQRALGAMKVQLEMPRRSF